MKKRLVESLEVPKTSKRGWWTEVQLVENILVLNAFFNKGLRARHCINIDTKEYGTLKGAVWSVTKIQRAYDLDTYWYSTDKIKEHSKMSDEDEQLVCDLLKLKRNWSCIADEISRLEEEYAREKRDVVENNRVRRVQAVMDKMPIIPDGIKEWIDQKALGKENYCLKVPLKKEDTRCCSACGQEFAQKLLQSPNRKNPGNKTMVTCPCCGEKIRYLTWKKDVDIWEHFCIIQPIDDEISVARHFSVLLQCKPGNKKRIGIDEDVRIVLQKKPRAGCDIFYNQEWPYMKDWVEEGTYNQQYFDNKSNPKNKREYPGYLYDDGIEKALKGTQYEPWTRLFVQFAGAGLKLDYNRLMAAHDANYRDLIEMLYRGRFYKLVQEQSERINLWTGGYWGSLRLSSRCIEDVFGIGDRQKINRIRDHNGGSAMVEWMRWSDRNKQKLSDKFLAWTAKDGIRPDEIQWGKCRFSMEQAMNYIEKQRETQYKGFSIRGVINQYEDYMNMCQKLKKDTSDEMIYRPRELKRRHDEAVHELEERQAEITADEYSRRYPGVETVLAEIKAKYTYASEKYTITVPNRCVDIVLEGRALHHCAGSSDRYFDRIESRETYICFLRKTEKPDEPFYTIEVEPGGTIRQHRGYLDEEPGIEEIKPFLREWQKVIRKRMTEKDHEYAKVSAVKREENIRELQEKNNTRVLQGLEEDFMEAVG